MAVAIPVRHLGRCAFIACVRISSTGNPLEADVAALLVAISGLTRGLLVSRAAVLVVTPLAFIWMIKLAAGLGIMGSDATQQRDRRKSVPGSSQDGHASERGQRVAAQRCSITWTTVAPLDRAERALNSSVWRR